MIILLCSLSSLHYHPSSRISHLTCYVIKAPKMSHSSQIFWLKSSLAWVGSSWLEFWLICYYTNGQKFELSQRLDSTHSSESTQALSLSLDTSSSVSFSGKIIPPPLHQIHHFLVFHEIGDTWDLKVVLRPMQSKIIPGQFGEKLEWGENDEGEWVAQLRQRRSDMCAMQNCHLTCLGCDLQCFIETPELWGRSEPLDSIRLSELEQNYMFFYLRYAGLHVALFL